MDRQILGILLLSVMTALFGIGIIIPVMPVFAVSLGASGLSLGMIIAAFSLSRGLLQPIVGSLSQHPLAAVARVVPTGRPAPGRSVESSMG